MDRPGAADTCDSDKLPLAAIFDGSWDMVSLCAGNSACGVRWCAGVHERGAGHCGCRDPKCGKAAWKREIPGT